MTSVKLSAKWQLDAALLSRPVDLTALVTMSRNTPEKFLEDNTLHRLVSSLLNEKNLVKSDKDTKLDVLNILANVAGASKACTAEARLALGGVSEWFDEYITAEESEPGQEPELHKAMVLLLARCWEYRLKTEDVLELTQGNRRIALCTVVGLLEDGETYSTELKQRQKPGQGKMAQWEHELVCHRYEKPLLLQICRLLRGFTHPGTYFEPSSEEIALFSVEKFAEEMGTLLEITLRSRLVEKLSVALYDCLFDDLENNDDDDEEVYDDCDGGNNGSGGDNNNSNSNGEDEKNEGKRGEVKSSFMLEESDNLAVASVHGFLQNLYFYASQNNEEYRRHLLMDTLLIPRLMLPYLDRCVTHALILNSRAEAYSDILEGDHVANLALHNPQLVKGIAATLRTLIIASFRAPATQFVMSLLRRLNPTSQMLRAKAFCKHNEYIFALLCMLNVNMGALDLSRAVAGGDQSGYETYNAHFLLHELAAVYGEMDAEKQARVYKRVMCSGALPISRDTPSFTAVMSVLLGGAAGQLEYSMSPRGGRPSGGSFGEADSKSDGTDMAATAASMNMTSGGGGGGDDELWDIRAEAKRAHADRLAMFKQVEQQSARPEAAASNAPSNDSQPKQPSAFQIAVAVAQAADAKDAKSNGTTGPNAAGAYRLLGELPTLGGNKNNKDRENIKIALALELPSEGNKQRIMQNQSQAPMMTFSGGKPDPTIPKEFLCAINGHAMKDPVYVKHNPQLVFERETIELWLTSRGSVCPLTLTPLSLEDLVPADDLRNKIKRYHIQQTTLRTVNQPDDDLYDF